MKNKFLKVGLFGLMLTSSLQVSASFIQHNGYSGGQDNIVWKGGSEWLAWSETVGQSINEALDTYASDGWQLATFSQMNKLYDDFGFLPAPNEDYTGEHFVDYIGATDEEPVDLFVSLFGWTAVGIGGYGRGIDGYHYTGAIYGSDSNGNGDYGTAEATSDYTRVGVGGYEVGGSARMRGEVNGLSRSVGMSGMGVALRRYVSVGEPSAFVIIALGIMGLATRRFKKQS